MLELCDNWWTLEVEEVFGCEEVIVIHTRFDAVIPGHLNLATGTAPYEVRDVHHFCQC